ncbi:hypothetical protein OUZ56_032061 [Daphnia magna]|uniref:Uncharacterized protein n=1 Tax=Daphnia magna TaxID=35525 RepID=A0ABQ9ZW44_9CRUS|nr:hypothetical protein OUZ56_032061 [Daphnia magna]
MTTKRVSHQSSVVSHVIKVQNCFCCRCGAQSGLISSIKLSETQLVELRMVWTASPAEVAFETDSPRVDRAENLVMSNPDSANCF